MAEFMYIGSNGAYGATNSTTTTLHQNLANAGGLLGSYNLGSLQQQALTSSSLADYFGIVSKPAKEAKRRVKGILANLRAEIGDWHGDILERQTA